MTKYVRTTGTPIKVESRRHGQGLKVSQGDSYLMLTGHEIEPFITALRDVCASRQGANTPRVDKRHPANN